MTYQQRLKIHLAEYRRHTLGVAKPGIFRYRGRDVQCEHILPADAWRLNLLELARPAAEEFLSKNPRKRHRYFHHLNSSQAFTLNLFHPYFDGGSAAAASLLRAFGQRDAPLSVWNPEDVLDPHEGTNIDVAWTTEDGVRTLCEVKLSENDLGKARDDERHRDKIRRIYAPLLQEHVESELLEPYVFVEAYQFLRNVWHLARKAESRLVFLLPRANVRPWHSLASLISKVAPKTRSRIRVVATEDVVDHLIQDPKCPGHLRSYAGDLRAKYIPGVVT